MTAYRSVSCDFYDELEALATLRRPCTLQYHTETGEKTRTEGQIMDLFSVEKAEYLRLRDGTEIRLDRLIAVDDKSVQFEAS